ncbi:TetR/AcrR family transcriptional regulator [Martelella sp. HB161492]|uniref:TetR/AcrR family transcriptional regulator n=1 Tax=Martelella sp. HB161492 TaxID=2720726 RepID=UPI001FEF51D8|nr:TetR/AcrR family transcriptional regulator [Martelella sp. HB161492]
MPFKKHGVHGLGSEGFCALRRSRRHAAGEDPVKRAQILKGAQRVFLRVGFDAASMNDITREAGVSKGTIYVYFENKEILFRTMILERKQQIFADLRTALETEGDTQTILHRFAVSLAEGLTREDTIRAMRIAIGVADRFPHLVRAFFGDTPENLIVSLSAYIRTRIDAGDLEIEDIDIAAKQFLELCSGHMWKMRLFGLLEEEPPACEINAMATRAVHMFMTCYATRPAR